MEYRQHIIDSLFRDTFLSAWQRTYR
jgi:hypothetical protein